MRPTAFGIKALAFYVTIVTAYFVSPYTNLFFGLLSFLSVLLISGCFSTLHNLAAVQAHIIGLTPYPAHSQQEVRLVLSAPRRVRFDLRVDLVIAGKRHPLGKVEVLCGEKETRGLLPQIPRGIHTITALRVHSSYPLGLLRCSRILAVEAPLIIHPRPIDQQARQNRNALDEVMGEFASKRGDMGPSGVREYVPGDPLKLIHWKATARRQQLVVKELEGHAAPGIEVQLDRRCEGIQLEQSLSLLTALCFEARDTKRPLALHTQGSSQIYGEGHQAFAELLTLLAGMTTLDASAASPPTVSPTVIHLPGRHVPSEMEVART